MAPRGNGFDYTTNRHETNYLKGYEIYSDHKFLHLPIGDNTSSIQRSAIDFA